MSWSLPTIIFLLTLGLAAEGAVLFYFLFCCEEDDSLPVASPPQPSPTSTTPLLYPSSPYNSYSRGQTNTRTSTTYGHHRNFYHSIRSPSYAGHSHRASLASTHAQPSYLQQPNSTRAQPPYLQQPSSSRISEAAASAKATDFAYRSDLASPHPGESRGTIRTSTPAHASHPPRLSSIRVGRSGVSITTTAGYGNEAHRTGLASHHVAESGRTASTSTRAQASYHQPTDNRVAGATAQTQIGVTTPDYDRYGYRSTLASSRIGESRVTSATPARIHVPPPSQLSTARVSQSTANTTTPAHHTNGVRHSHSHPPPRETFLTGLAPSLTQATYQCTHSLVTNPHAFEDAESRPENSHALPSPSSPGHPGIASSTRLIPLSLSRVPNAQSGVEFEAATTVEDMKAATALRGRARRSNREMREARDLAKSARKRGDQTAAERHRQDAIAHESEMKSLDKRAAKIIFRENNKALTKGTVDLHGLYVAEAMECAKKELESATCRNDDEICFIVGKGLHSRDGQPKLRPRLEELCAERWLTYSLDPKNPGMLRVRLK